MSTIRLQFVHEFKDRHGITRRYFRRRGYKQVPLPGLVGSIEFMDAYQQALAGETAPKIENGAKRSKPGSVADAVAKYFDHGVFQNLASETKRTRRNILERFRDEHGEKRIGMLRLEHIDKMLAAKKSTPSSARNFLNTLRALVRFCISARLLKSDPTIGATRAPIKTTGYRTWSEEDIAAFEVKHPIGSRPRLALALLLYTAQRRSDIVRMGRQHIRDNALHVRQQKTETQLVIPVHSTLQEILGASKGDHLTFLTTAYGKPFTPAGFTNWFREQCNNAGLPVGTSAHGLRKAACRRLAEAGCSANVIASISGHISLREVQRYTKDADQIRMAKTGMDTMVTAFPAPEKRTTSGKPE